MHLSTVKSNTELYITLTLLDSPSKERCVCVHLLQGYLQETAPSGGSKQAVCQRFVFQTVWHMLKAWSFLY